MKRVTWIIALALFGCGPGGGNPDGGGGGGYLVFPDQSLWTHQPSIDIDSAGALHLGYTTSLAGGSGHPIRYAYCAGGCGNKTGWTVVELNDGAFGEGQVSVRLFDGKPRVLWFHEVTQAYFISICDAECTKLPNWTTTQVADTAKRPEADTHFAIDAAGKPAFVYLDSRIGREGIFFIRCTGNCNDRTQWTEVKLNVPAGADRFALAFDAQSRPRIVYRDPLANQIGYLQCDSSCTSTASFQGGTVLSSEAGHPALKLDKQGRPRLLHMSGNKLFLAWCDSNCTQANGWQRAPVGAPEGYGSAGFNLVLDANDRPRIAYSTANNGVGYSSCKDRCTSSDPIWRHAVVETGPQLDQRAPMEVAQGCSTSSWMVGEGATLALDPNGNPRLIYEVRHQKGGSCLTATDAQYVRVAAFAEVP